MGSCALCDTDYRYLGSRADLSALLGSVLVYKPCKTVPNIPVHLSFLLLSPFLVHIHDLFFSLFLPSFSNARLKGNRLSLRSRRDCYARAS